jgi:hypothetical protein
MAPTSAARRLTLVAVLVALLGALGVVPARDVAVSADPSATVGVAPVDAMAPSRAAGRLVAEPSLVCVVSELPAGTVPGGTPPVALVRLDDRPAGAITTRYVALRGAAGVRAPPRQVDL